MRRKCRPADTWLTQCVLLDSWNVTLSRGAERSTLNVSLSNNRPPFIRLVGTGAETTDPLRRGKHFWRFFSPLPSARRAKLLSPIKNNNAGCCFLLFVQTENIENLHMLSPCSADTGVRCRLHLHQQHKSTNGGKGRKAILHISGDDGAWKGMLFFCGLVIKYVEIGLGNGRISKAGCKLQKL